MDPKLQRLGRGPFTSEMVREGDRYELDRGHAVYAAPGGGEHGRTSGIGYAVLASDPLVEEAGVDVGYVVESGSLRAPDIAIGNVPDRPGWVRGAPPLAVEYASTGQDEEELALRIGQLLAAGTRFVWVVRLKVPRHVEVHERGAPVRIVTPGNTLEAAGILAHSVPVEALWDGRIAADVTFHNLLSRRGYETLDEVRREAYQDGVSEGVEQGLERGLERGATEALRTSLVQILTARFGEVAARELTPRLQTAVLPDLQRWLETALAARDPSSALP